MASQGSERGPFRELVRPVTEMVRSLTGTRGLSDCLCDVQHVLHANSAANTRIDEQLSRIGNLLEEIRAGNHPAGAAAQTKMGIVESLLAAAVSTERCYSLLVGNPPVPTAPPPYGDGSRLCNQGDFNTDAFRYWMARMRIQPTLHRKLWEWFFAADVLWREDMLRAGRKGLGFGVGQEPLTALFAAAGVEVVATDMDPEAAREEGWVQTGQHAADIATLDKYGICDPSVLRDRVQFRTVDMNAIPADLTGFDFCWSSCALEHLGSLRHGVEFVRNAMRCLRPGGIAVHTTEFNMSSNDVTLERPDLSLYRRRDIEELVAALNAEGHRVEPIDWKQGAGFADGYVDVPPYTSPIHLRLRIAEFTCTSVGLVIHALDPNAADEAATGGLSGD